MLTPKSAKIIILVTRLWMYDGTNVGSSRSSTAITMTGSKVVSQEAGVFLSVDATALRARRPPMKMLGLGCAAIRTPCGR
jgi:hypothetical protein